MDGRVGLHFLSALREASDMVSRPNVRAPEVGKLLVQLRPAAP